MLRNLLAHTRGARKMAAQGALAPLASMRATRSAYIERRRSPTRSGRPFLRDARVVCRSAADAADTSTPSVDAQRPPLRVIIVGAGIGGLATCLALRRVGVDAHVYERALSLKADAGTGIALWPNGLKALRAIGKDVEREVADRGASISGVRFTTLRDDPPVAMTDTDKQRTLDTSRAGIAFLSSRLKSLASAALTRAVPALLRAKHGAGLVCIRWASAQAALASFLPAECVHLDATLSEFAVVDFADGSKGVAVSFARRDGTPVSDDGPLIADVLLGADGVNSATRAAILKDGPPRDNGRVIWRAVVRASDVARVFRDESDDGSSSDGGSTAAVSFPPFCPARATALSASEDAAVGRTTCFMDVGGGELYWAAGCLDTSAVLAGDGSDDAANCAATFAGNPEVLACLEATTTSAGPPRRLVASRVVDRAPLDAGTFQAALRETVGDAAETRVDDATATSGDVTEKKVAEKLHLASAPVSLLGDAAHPVIPSFGQGANLALEDAVELALALAFVDRARAPRALRRWERARFARTESAQIASFLTGSRSYGPEQLRAALEASGLARDATRRRERAFPDANKTQDWLLGWTPSASVALPDLAPARALALARRAASAAKPAGVGGIGDEFGDAGAGARFFSSAFLFFFGAAAATATLSAAAAPASAAALETFVGDGFQFDLPGGWRAVDLPGVSVSKTRLAREGPAAAPAPPRRRTYRTEKELARESFVLTREPTFTMGAAGLESLYGSAETFGETVAGSRRGELLSARVSSSGDAFVAEGVSRTEPRATRWLELVACGCRGGENARKYNLLQTISIAGETADDGAFESMRAVADSFRLTAGKTCDATRDVVSG